MLTIELINAKRSLIDRFLAWGHGGSYLYSFGKNNNKIIQVWYNSQYPFLEVLLHEFGHYNDYSNRECSNRRWTWKEILREVFDSLFTQHNEQKAHTFVNSVSKEESISIKINEPIRIILKE